MVGVRLPTHFDAKKHLAYEAPASRITMKELALEDVGIAPIGVTAPFPLFSKEGVTELRREILSKDLLDKYGVVSHVTPYQAREYPSTAAPFIHEVWKSQEVIDAVSEAAGIELIPIMDLEFGSTNFQLGPKGIPGVPETSIEALPPAHATSPEDLAKYQEMAEKEDGSSPDNVVAWHYDSYPFVCVVMLSDVSQMVGGETALQCGDGRIVKARGPGLGYAVVMQGRHIKHTALRSYNTGERITMVTSFRAKDPLVRDASVLSTIRYISKKNRLNYQWSVYRLKLLTERFQALTAELEAKKEALGDDNDADGQGGGEVVNVASMQKWLEEQITYLSTTGDELHK